MTSLYKESSHEYNWTDKTVLIVEDEKVNFLYFEELLIGTGIEVIYAKNGKIAVDYCQTRDKIDIVLMDIRTPIMNGYQATTVIKQFRPSLPIIAVTAFGLQEDEEKALNAGCNYYIAKPFRKDLLLQKMAYFFKQSAKK